MLSSTLTDHFLRPFGTLIRSSSRRVPALRLEDDRCPTLEQLRGRPLGPCLSRPPGDAAPEMVCARRRDKA
jgi:hypothetical protein